MQSFESIALEVLKSNGIDFRSAPTGRGLRLVNKAWRGRERESASLYPYVDVGNGAIAAVRRYWAKGGCTDSLLEYICTLESEASRLVNK
jgi:hypothetical protein